MSTPAPVPRSNFVTVLAWVMIAFGALSAMMALMQGVLLNLYLPTLESTFSQAGPLAGFSFAFLRGWMLAGFAFSVLTTYAACALLQRRNWARIFHIVLFLLGSASHAAIAAALAFGTSLVILPLADAGILPPELQSAFRAAAIACAILLLAFGVGYVWLARRLLSPAIAAEFGVPRSPAV